MSPWVCRRTTHTGSGEGPHILGVEREGPHILGVERDHTYWEWSGTTHTGSGEGPHILGVERDHTYWEWRGDHTYWEWRGTTHTGSGEGTTQYWEWRGTTHTGSGEGPHILGVERDHTYWEWSGTTHTGNGVGPHILGVERACAIIPTSVSSCTTTKVITVGNNSPYGNCPLPLYPSLCCDTSPPNNASYYCLKHQCFCSGRGDIPKLLCMGDIAPHIRVRCAFQ